MIPTLGLLMAFLGGAPAGLPPMSGPRTSSNTIVFHDISDAVTSSVWITSGGNNGRVNSVATATITANAGGQGLHAFNTGGASDVRRETLFRARSTSSTFHLDAKAHAGDSPGSKIAIAIARVSDNATIAHTTITLTGSLDTYAVQVATTTGEEYFARASNDPALGADPGARAYLGAQSVTVDGATGDWGDFDVYHPAKESWWSNAETYEYAGNGYWRFTTARGEMASPLAFLPLETDAPKLIVECSSTMYQGYVDVGLVGQGYIPAGTGVSILVNGTTWQTNYATADSKLEDAVYTLPGGTKSVEIYNPGRTNIGAGTFLGRVVRAIYVPRGAGFRHLGAEPVTTDTIMIGGTSIMCGFNPSEPGRYAIARQLRELTGRRVVCDAVGGNIAYNYTGATYWNEWAAKIAAQNPADFVCDMGTNDHQQGGVNPQITRATFISYYVSQLTAIHAASPNTRCWLMKAIYKPVKDPNGVNGEGFTLDSYRDAIDEVASALGNPSWLHVVNAKNWVTFLNYQRSPPDDFVGLPLDVMYNDNVHPNDQGQTKMAQQIALMLAA